MLGHNQSFPLLSKRPPKPLLVSLFVRAQWGGDQTRWSRVFKYFNLFISDVHGHCLRDYFHFWEPRYDVMADAIKRKLVGLGVQYEEDEVQPISVF